MNATLRRRLERAMRVRDFIRANRTDGAGEATALTRLEELIQRADVLAAQQRAGVVATRAATMQREELRHTLFTKLLKYLAEGYTNKEIARAMVLAEDTVKKAVQTLIAKLGATDRTHAVVLALRSDLIQ